MRYFNFLTIPVIIILIIYSPLKIFAQNYLSMPESICYNSISKKYYVSSLNNGRIVEIDTNGNQTIIITGQTQCAGNTIQNNILYFSCTKNVRGYDISVSPPNMVMDIYISDAVFLDGMALDNAGNLYVCDNRYPNSGRIIKINLESQAFWTFVPSGYGLTVSLQDALFDEANNRLIIASATSNNSIQMVRFSDSSVVNISSQVKLIDGIARDNEGNYYFTSWQTYALHKFDSSFSGNAVIVAGSLNGPSQPCYNPDKNLIAVPLFNGNQIAYIQLEPQAVKNQSLYAKEFSLSQNYPNPFNPSTRINFSIPKSGLVILNIYDASGRLITNLVSSHLRYGVYTVDFNAGGYSSGVYFCKLNFDNYSETKRMIFAK